KFNESSLTNANDDQSSSNYDGTLTNMTGSEWTPSSAFFGPKNALDFDGFSDYVDISASSSLNNDNFTVEMWAKIDATQTWNTLLDKGLQHTPGDWYFVCINGSYGVIFGYNSSNEFTFNFGDNGWHHIAVTCDGTSITGYLDGIQIHSSSSSYTKSTNAIRMGRRVDTTGSLGSYDFNGKLDEVRIWNSARSADQIRENMCNSITGGESGLVAYYNFDNTSGATLQDFSGNSNDGTLYNMANDDWVTSAAFNSWLNTASTSWSTATNWSDGAVPASDNVGIYNWSGGSDPSSIADNTTVNNLFIGSLVSTEVSEGNSLTVDGNLFVEGTFTVASNAMSNSGTGSLITKGEIAGDVKVERYVDGGSGGYVHYVSPPISDGTGADILDATIGDYNAYKYVPGGSPVWSRIYSADALSAGTGYYVAYNGNKTISYTGTLNTGNVTVAVSNSGTGYNLIGNPYPSRIDASDFVNDNSDISGSLYYWADDHGHASGYTTDDYATWNVTGATAGTGAGATGGGSTTTPNMYVEVGQAFFIQASSAGTVTFTNDHRLHTDPAAFYTPPTDNRQRIWLNLISTDHDISNNILIGFLEGATIARDRLYDAEKLRGNENIAFYSLIENDDESYVIQGLPPITEDVSIALGFYAGFDGNYSIAIDSIDNFYNKIILEDLYEQKLTELSKTPNYEFTTNSGEFDDRFVLHFSSKNNKVENKNVSDIKVNAFKNSIIIIDPSSKAKELFVYDISGKLLFNKMLKTSNYHSLNLNLAKACYIIKIKTDKGNVVKKMIID
ncbi:MAG: LamG-like jellyroll fold domain-containing protein, partial [Bacteroidota bacterium]|nr:LamG-like jellyroll fold domain-containing protein [Bacteroidota bacterium]